MPEVSRRQFVALTVMSTGVAGACECDAMAAPGDKPRRPPEHRPGGKPGEGPPPPQPPQPASLEAGTLDQYPDDGVYDKFAKTARAIVYRNQGKLYASTARCSHKGCGVMADGKIALACPCHGSGFDIAGKPTTGPAVTALFRYAIKLDANKKIIVDLKKQLLEADWEKPESFIALA